jgi:hypothetical protein
MMMMMMIMMIIIIVIIIIIIIIIVCFMFCGSYKWIIRLFSTSVMRRLTGTQDSLTADVQCNIYS